MLRIFFVRHGRTDWNAQGRVQGGGDLDEIGKAQAESLSARLQNEPFRAAYASPFPRTRQTASIIAEPHDIDVRLLPLLRDLDYGHFAGALLSEVREQNPDLWARWRDAPETVHFEGGEGLADLRQRIKRAISIINNRHTEGSVLCVTHDSPVRVVMSLALGFSDSRHNDQALVTPLASLTIAKIDEEGISLELMRDVSHLEGIDDSL